MRSGYKQTELGVLPEEWETDNLHRFWTVTDCKHITAQFVPQGFPVASIREVQSRFVDLANAKQTTAHFYNLLIEGGRKPYPGDLILSRNATVGEVAQISVEHPLFAMGQDVCLLRRRSGDHSTAFLQSVFQSPIIRKQLADLMVGSTFKRVNVQQIRNFTVPMPLPSEQRAIAEALSDVDELLGGLARLIAKKRDLKQAVMQQLLTGQIRLPGFGPTAAFKKYAFGSIPADWNVKTLKSVSTMNGRIGWQGLKQEEFTMNPNDPFLITGMNLKDGKIRWDEVYHISEQRYLEALPIQLRPNDVLMTKDGTIGKLLYVERIPHPGRASLNSHLLVFRPIADQYNPRFLFYQLSSPTFAQHVELHKSGTTFFGLSQTATGKYPTILPSIPEQIAIASVLTEMDAELGVLEQRLEKTRALKQAMMQELLTGHTRLVSTEVAHA